MRLLLLLLNVEAFDEQKKELIASFYDSEA